MYKCNQCKNSGTLPGKRTTKKRSKHKNTAIQVGLSIGQLTPERRKSEPLKGKPAIKQAESTSKTSQARKIDSLR